MFHDAPFNPEDYDYPRAVDAPEPDADGLLIVHWLGTSDHAEAGQLLFGAREAGSIMPRPGLLGRLVYSLRHGCWLRLDERGIWRMEAKARVRTLAEEQARQPGKPVTWHAGHTVDGDNLAALLPEHSTCNQSAGATAGNLSRSTKGNRWW
jgi:hypothetical protein